MTMKSSKKQPQTTTRRKRRQVKSETDNGSSRACGGILKRSSYANTKAGVKLAGTKPDLKANKSKSKSTTFLSVLSQPFAPWNELEVTIGEFCSEWSHTRRSFIVQNLVRFLELKVLTEEFSKTKLLAPTPLLARAWKAVILDSKLYLITIYAIQDFHELPHKVLRYPLQRRDMVVKEGSSNAKRLARTKHLFKYYYGETMLSSIEEVDGDMSLADTSTITEGLGVWNLPVPRCGPSELTPDSSGRTSSRQSNSSSFKNLKLPPWWSRNNCLDAVGDILLFCTGNDVSDCGSLTGTIILDDIEEKQPEPNEQPDTTEARETITEYDSLFTYDFWRTRHFLCRNGSQNNACHDGLHVFSW